MSHPNPPPGSIRARLNAVLESEAARRLLLRASAALAAVAMLYVAVLVWLVGQLYRPGHADGLPPPEGDIQFYLATAGATASLAAAFFCFGYALTQKRARATWITLLIAIAASAAWRIFLTQH